MISKPRKTFRILVDPANPGQFYACCGLLELADRLWAVAEAWFEDGGRKFCLSADTEGEASLLELIGTLKKAGLSGALTCELEEELNELQENRRRLKKEGKSLAKRDEVRRNELGKLSRSGAIQVGDPFNLRLDWWQDDSDEAPKTWAGSQQVLRIAKAAVASCEEAFRQKNAFDYACILHPQADGPEGFDENDEALGAKIDDAGKVEPFYFDARRGSHALPIDIGFSPDSLKMKSAAYPAVEFLCLVGLQRFRPVATVTTRVFEYCTWKWPLPSNVAPAATVGVLDRAVICRYRFENAFRTDQRKHKAFTAATEVFKEKRNGESV